jgi:integrase
LQRLEDTTKIATATANLSPSYVKALQAISPENAELICDYILAEITESNIRDSTKEWKIKVLLYLARSLRHKSFREATKEDVLAYLSQLRKPEAKDPKQKWVGTYNNRVLVYTKFFRWLYNTGESDHRKRVTPPCMKGIKQLKRREKSPYKPSDLWTPIEIDLFLRYCPSRRDKCYVAMALDTSARPHELLALRIEDIHFKANPKSGVQYAEILVSGKTKTRTIPLIYILPYVKDWIAQHPQTGNPKAPLFPSQSDKNRGTPLKVDGLWWHFKYYKVTYFKRLLGSPDFQAIETDTIKSMLEKPWNPYIFRHTALTEKAQILKEAMLRDHAGWTTTSKMPALYLHFFGGESSKSLLEARGIISGQEKESSILQPKCCPNCQEPNTPHNKFCSKCKMVLTYEEYATAAPNNIQVDLQDQISEMRAMLNELMAGKGGASR